jgi:hypothetical protein
MGLHVQGWVAEQGPEPMGDDGDTYEPVNLRGLRAGAFGQSSEQQVAGAGIRKLGGTFYRFLSWLGMSTNWELKRELELHAAQCDRMARESSLLYVQQALSELAADLRAQVQKLKN